MKIRLFVILCAFATLSAWGQSAQSILNKTASLLSRGAMTAHFTTKGAMGTTTGQIVVQGSKFVLTSPKAHIWFDGKTEWALAQGSGEVNVTNPTSAEIAAMNPMNFITLYKRGYSSTVADKGGSHEIHLTASNAKAGIKEAYVTISKNTSLPQSVRVRTGSSSWTTIIINSLQNGGKKADAFFRFNAKDYPRVDVVDLR